MGNGLSFAVNLLTIVASLLLAPAAACGQVSAVPRSGETATRAVGRPRRGKTVKQAAGPVRRPRDTVTREVPEKIDVNARYLFYLHGRIIQDQGLPAVSPRFGRYEYEEILAALAARGFHVISEPRARGTDPVEYARKVVKQVEALTGAGVPSRNVTIIGASYGGAIAAFVSTLLKNRDVNFVLMASCGDSDLYGLMKVDLAGRVLSVYDHKDDTGVGTCERFFAQSSGIARGEEVVLRLGTGHGMLYRPVKGWVDLVAGWAVQP